MSIFSVKLNADADKNRRAHYRHIVISSFVCRGDQPFSSGAAPCLGNTLFKAVGSICKALALLESLKGNQHLAIL